MSNGIEETKRTTSNDFNRRAAGFDARGTFAHFGGRLIEHTGLDAGMRVLDVATGRGAVLFPARERVGESGEAVGIDLAASMVQATIDEAQRRGLNVSVQVMDAEHLDFPDASFDRVVCGFGIMFFPNLSKALSEFRRVLKSPGRVGVSTWRVSQGAYVRPVLEEVVPDAPSQDLPPGWITEPEVLQRALTDAKFANVDVITDAVDVHYTDVDDFIESVRGTVQTLNNLDEIQMRRVRHALSERFRSHERPDGIYLPAVALLASGKL